MDLRLAPELGLDRMHREAVALHAAVAAPLADRLIDEDTHLGVRQPAALAEPALLGGAALVVHERRHAGNIAQQSLRLVEPVAVPYLDPGGPGGALRVLVGLVGHHDDPLDALGCDRA